MSSWESRLFIHDADVGKVLEVLSGVFDKVKPSAFANRPLSEREARTDAYVAVASAVYGLKFRDGAWLELKTRDDLLGVDDFPLSERWNKQRVPGSHLAALFSGNEVSDDAFEQLADALSESQPTLAGLLRQRPRRRVVVRKTRWSIGIGAAVLEVAELELLESATGAVQRVVSLCIEGAPPMKLCNRLVRISNALDAHKIRHDAGGYPSFLL